LLAAKTNSWYKNKRYRFQGKERHIMALKSYDHQVLGALWAANPDVGLSAVALLTKTAVGPLLRESLARMWYAGYIEYRLPGDAWQNGQRAPHGERPTAKDKPRRYYRLTKDGRAMHAPLAGYDQGRGRRSRQRR
jgi:hypothetical protein